MFGATSFATNPPPAQGFAQPQQSGAGLFGQSTPSTTTFGQTTPAMSTFGQTASAPGFGFGQTQQQPGTLFGQTQQPQQTSSLFGQSQPAQQTSLFNQTQQPQQTAPLFGQQQSTFGQQTTTQPSSSLFGQQPATQPSSSLFGQQPATQPSTSLFGQQPSTQPSTSLFGQQPSTQPSTSLFGQQPTAQSSTTLFGQQSTTQPSTTLFGQQPTSQPSSSLFGQQTTTQPSSSLFGQQPSSSLFGQQTTNQPSSSLFGQQTTTQPSSSLFGQPTGTQPSSSLFGQPQTTSLFGQPQQPQQSSFSFAQPQQQQQQQQQQRSLFGSTPATGGSFTSSWPAGPNTYSQQPPQALQPSLPAWEIEIQAIVNSYDPNHPQCRFQYALYNKVDDATGIEPAPAFRVHTGLYQQAVRENPDPKHLVPVPALGFEALKQRIAEQGKARAHHSIEIEICKERINQLEQDHDCTKKVSVPEYRQRHLDLSRRLLAIAKTLDIQQGRGFPRSDAELKLTKELEALERATDKLRVSVEGIASSVPVQDSQESQIDMFKLNPSDPNFKRIYEFLDQQRESLKHLITLLSSDSRDVNAMIKAYSQKVQSDQPNLAIQQ